ncbi:hypothetical protein GCM10010371_34320 [Streptomyces subrutilus]|uniref:Isochorismatase family protein n=1 Tax=Streptomyces subrutilus TaxID=36818 RepID=A0A5P2URG0_9ACTN|nr:isochorismatase family protein [Streptomyces subrutilus]QEU81916.1 isochorismatase family protein [Streptomyces subrutilus]GGZ71761.1 hypothetical protein GCM10010371_34320 [Streptomyces subrutilus]
MPSTTTRATRALVPIDQMPRVIALPLAPHSGDEVLARCGRLAEAFRAAGEPVVLVRVEHPAPPHGARAAGSPTSRAARRHRGRRADIGAFHRTGLDERLRERGVDTRVLAGPVATTGRAEHCPGTRRTGGPSDGPRTAGPTGPQTSGPPSGPMPP